MAEIWTLFLQPVTTATATLVGGTIDFYSPGTTGESNRKDVWLDPLEDTVAANPYTLDSNATAVLYGSGMYHIIIKDSNGVTKYDYDNVTPAVVISALVTPEATIASIYDLTQTTASSDGQKETVLSFFDGLDKGGGQFYWDDDRDKADADGAKIIDPDNLGSFDGTQPTLASLFSTQGTGVGTGCWVRMSSKSMLTFEDFGAVVDSTTDDTPAFEKACASEETIYLHEGTMVLDEAYVTSSIKIVLGTDATLYHKDASVQDMIIASGDTFILQGGVVDGNRANRTTRNKTELHITAADVRIEGTTFTGSIFNALWLEDGIDRVWIENCTFKDMEEHDGTSGHTTMAVLIRADTGNPVINFNKNYITAEAPSVSGRGPGGIIVDGDSIEELFITNNTFDKIGQGASVNFIGSVDLYTTADKTVITNNKVKSYYFTPFKLMNSGELIVTGNIVDGNAANVNLPCITIQNGRNIGTAFGNIIISDNILTVDDPDTGARGITLYGDADGDDFLTKITVSNNIITNTDIGVDIQWAADIYMSNNIIDTTLAQGVKIHETDTGTGAPSSAQVSVQGGSIINCGGKAISAEANVGNLSINVNGVQFRNNTTTHIKLDQINFATIVGNTFEDTPSGGTVLEISNTASALCVGNFSLTGASTSLVTAITKLVNGSNTWN